MKILAFATLLATISMQAKAETKSVIMPADSSHTVDIEEVVVVAPLKENLHLRQTATSVSLFSEQILQSEGTTGMSNLSGYAPNFFMPNYGSAQTSAIYIRGVGSRINTPAVALYVDNIPVADKSTYNTPLFGINRIDVLRGPQGTLYGRNAMGGIVRIYTDNPLLKQGTEIRTGASSRDDGAYLSAFTHQKIANTLGISAGGYYKYNNGIYRNDTLGKKVGGGNDIGGKLRLVYQPEGPWKFDFSTTFDYTDQNTYPYFYSGSLTGTESMPQIVDHITANRESKYRRSNLSSGFLAEYGAKHFTVSSITSYQYLNDRLLMDQDFIYQDFYTLEQKQKSHALTEEIVLKSKPGKRLEWAGGAFGMWQNLRTEAPVTFYDDGISMLNGIFARVLPDVNYTMNVGGRSISSTMTQSLVLTDPTLPIYSRFRTPVLNGALFAQGTLHDILPQTSLTLGMRLDHEHQTMNYMGGGLPVNYSYDYNMGRHEASDLTATPTLGGKVSNKYTRLLPKMAITYNLNDNKGNLYASVAQGHRSGGYNIQMFSDVMRTALQADMTKVTKQYVTDVLTQHAQSMPAMSDMFYNIINIINTSIPETHLPDVGTTLTYKPEYCWNYEAGTHLNLFDRSLTVDLSALFFDTRNQQISRFTDSGMGRIMVNAGESHSCGLEASVNSHLFNDRITLTLNYGYTHAIFHKYDEGNGNDYTDNRVPFIPEHNMGLFADYKQPVNHTLLKNVTIGVNTNGFGRIYWTEANNAYQNFYATLGSHVQFDFGKVALNLWAKNITQTKYKSFYFETMNRGYYQKGYPTQIGFDLSFKF